MKDKIGVFEKNINDVMAEIHRKQDLIANQKMSDEEARSIHLKRKTVCSFLLKFYLIRIFSSFVWLK